jgi:hypothetical protein
MTIRSIRRADGDVTVVVADTLTPDDAVCIRDLVRTEAVGGRVTIDVRSARNCPAHPLLMLSHVRSHAGAPLAFVGLSGANERLLRYFYVPLPPRERVEAGVEPVK